MRTTIILWVISFLFIEGLRFIIPFDRLANEVQLLSAVPWIPPVIYHQWKLREQHKRIEQHLKTKESEQHVQGK